jgi:hypothetical protein
MCHTPSSRSLLDNHTTDRDDQEDEPKLYAKTLVPLNPDHPEDGSGIPAGVIVEVTDENNRMMAHYHGVSVDVLLSELDPE